MLSRPLVFVLRSATVRRAAVRLSDLDMGRATLDSALRAHAAERLAQRSADEANRRLAYATVDH
jgi:hypothetical protein